MRLPLLAAVLLLATPVLADEVFRWVDEEGEVHYTNDPDAIPSTQKKKAKVTKGTELGSINSSGAPTKKGPPPKPRDPEAEARAAQDQRDTEANDRREAAASEASWRAQFREAKQKVAGLEAELEGDRKRLEDPGGSGMAITRDVYGRVLPSPEYEQLRRRVAVKETELARAKEDLNDLDRRASHQSVPREWRR